MNIDGIKSNLNDRPYIIPYLGLSPTVLKPQTQSSYSKYDRSPPKPLIISYIIYGTINPLISKAYNTF